MSGNLSDSLDDANAAAYEEFDGSEAGATVQECPGSRIVKKLAGNAKRNLGRAKDAILGFRDAVKEKLSNLFTEEDRAGLEIMKDNVGGFPIVNAHGMTIDAIFYRVNKEFGWDKEGTERSAQEGQ